MNKEIERYNLHRLVHKGKQIEQLENKFKTIFDEEMKKWAFGTTIREIYMNVDKMSIGITAERIRLNKEYNILHATLQSNR